MIETIEVRMDEYWKWLKERTRFREVDEWVEITTPFLDRHNDYLQIYVRKEGNSYKLSDGGAVIQDLELCGCDLSTEKRKVLLNTVLLGLGVKKEEDGSLVTSATSSTFPMRKHRLVQAMLSVDDMFFTASPVVKSLFLEDMALWLDGNEIRYTPSVKLTGKSGYDHNFDFVIPRSARYPERILQGINNPNKSSAELFTFKWMDTIDARPAESNAYVFLNDVDGVPSNVTDAFKSYDIAPVPWSYRDKFLLELAG